VEIIIKGAIAKKQKQLMLRGMKIMIGWRRETDDFTAITRQDSS
jgi:hypothetical protein